MPFPLSQLAKFLNPVTGVPLDEEQQVSINNRQAPLAAMHPSTLARRSVGSRGDYSHLPTCEAAAREIRREDIHLKGKPNKNRQNARYSEADREMVPESPPKRRMGLYRPGLPVLKRQVESGNLATGGEYDDRTLGGELHLPHIEAQPLQNVLTLPELVASIQSRLQISIREVAITHKLDSFPFTQVLNNIGNAVAADGLEDVILITHQTLDNFQTSFCLQVSKLYTEAIEKYYKGVKEKQLCSLRQNLARCEAELRIFKKDFKTKRQSKPLPDWALAIKNTKDFVPDYGVGSYKLPPRPTANGDRRRRFDDAFDEDEDDAMAEQVHPAMFTHPSPLSARERARGRQSGPQKHRYYTQRDVSPSPAVAPVCHARPVIVGYDEVGPKYRYPGLGDRTSPSVVDGVGKEKVHTGYMSGDMRTLNSPYPPRSNRRGTADYDEPSYSKISNLEGGGHKRDHYYDDDHIIRDYDNGYGEENAAFSRDQNSSTKKMTDVTQSIDMSRDTNPTQTAGLRTKETVDVNQSTEMSGDKTPTKTADPPTWPSSENQHNHTEDLGNLEIPAVTSNTEQLSIIVEEDIDTNKDAENDVEEHRDDEVGEESDGDSVSTFGSDNLQTAMQKRKVKKSSKK